MVLGFGGLGRLFGFGLGFGAFVVFVLLFWCFVVWGRGFFWLLGFGGEAFLGGGIFFKDFSRMKTGTERRLVPPSQLSFSPELITVPGEDDRQQKFRSIDQHSLIYHLPQEALVVETHHKRMLRTTATQPEQL